MRADHAMARFTGAAGIAALAREEGEEASYGSIPASRRPNGTVLRVARHFRAPATRVFGAWLDPGSAGRWLFATASRPLERVEIDGRVGGAFRLVELQRGRMTEHTGRYLEILPPRRLAFTLSLDARSTRVVIDIVPRPAGCRLLLTHEDVPADAAQRIRGRWTGILYGLGVTVDGSTFSRRSDKE